MKKKLFFFIPLFLVLSGCAVTEEKTDLLSHPGMETQSDLFPSSIFLPYSKVFQPYKSAWLVKNPARQQAIFSVLRGVKLDSNGIYELRMRYSGQEQGHFTLHGYELKNGEILKAQVLLNTMSYLNVNGVVEYRKPFAVSPDCEQFLSSLTLRNPGRNGHATELLIEELSICRIGTMKTALPGLGRINYASEYDFSRHPEGDFQKIRKGLGVNAKKWSDVKAEVVKVDGEKVLHILRKPENYIYPYFELKPFLTDPRYHFIKLTFKVKGKGSIKPGLWWKRETLSFDYYHGKEVKLTDDWQDVSLIHPCMTPDVKNAAVSFTSSGHGEFWIKDISVNCL